MAEKCQLETIVDSFEALDNHDDKLSYIDGILGACGKCDVASIPSVSIKGKKKGKKTSSWICYNKVCAEETNRKYMECVSDKERAKTEYYGMKDYWKEQSDKGCPMEVPKKRLPLSSREAEALDYISKQPNVKVTRYPTLE